MIDTDPIGSDFSRVLFWSDIVGKSCWLIMILELIAINGFAQEVKTPKQKPTTAPTELLLPYETVREKDGKLFYERDVPDMSVEGVPYKITYLVSVPVVENGRTVMRTEQRIRTEIKRPTIKKSVRMDTTYRFVNLNEKEFDIDQVVKLLDGKPKRMLVWNEGRSLPKIWHEFVRPDLIIARIIPTDGDKKIPDRVLNDLDELQGLWRGSWGLHQDAQGAISTPVIAELLINGDQASWHGFRIPDGEGVVSIQTNDDKRFGRLAYAEDSTTLPNASPVTFTYVIEGETLLLEINDHQFELDRKRKQ